MCVHALNRRDSKKNIRRDSAGSSSVLINARCVKYPSILLYLICEKLLTDDGSLNACIENTLHKACIMLLCACCTSLLREREGETSVKRMTGFDINQQDCISAIIQQ